MQVIIFKTSMLFMLAVSLASVL